MNQEELFSYVYDFLSQLLENKDIFPHLRRIILYGSVVRGDFRENSDIDVFIDSNFPQKIKNKVKGELNKFEARTEKTWALRGLSLPLKIIVDNLSHSRWKELREEILSYGKIVYGPFESLPLHKKLYFLIIYELKTKHQAEKMAFLRHLYGYNSKKKKKEYLQKGLLEQIKGLKLEANVLLIPPESWILLKKVFLKFKINYTIREIWSK